MMLVGVFFTATLLSLVYWVAVWRAVRRFFARPRRSVPVAAVDLRPQAG